MPTIARIRFANVVYENRQKRYNDEIFTFDGHNGAILLENGGGKTVFVQTLLQVVIPHLSLAGRKIKDTLVLAQSPAHIAVEWILHEQPRVYGLTVVTLFLKNEELHSYKYTYRYGAGDQQNIAQLPFTVCDAVGRKRGATAEEMHDYYLRMNERSVSAKLFNDISDYTKYLETNFKLVNEEWISLATINSGEGDVAKFFEACKTTNDLVNKLLIPTVLLGMKGDDKASFTEIFEEKRTNLRKSKQLKRQIQEHQAVEEQISRMMGIYKEQHEQEDHFYALQQQGKSFYEEAKRREHELAGQLVVITANKQSLECEKKLLYEQTESLGIAERRQQEEIALEGYSLKQVAYQQCADKLVILEQEKETLDYLRDKQDRDSKGAQIKEEEDNLGIQEKQQDSELLVQLQKVHCQLRGIYDQKEVLYRQNLVDLETQSKITRDEIQQRARVIKKQDALRQEVEQQGIKHKTLIDLLEAEENKIALQILANVREQQVGTELVKWKQDTQYVQQSLAEQIKIRNLTEQAHKVKGQQVVALTAQEATTYRELEKVESRMDENRRKHQGVLTKLHEIPSLRTVDSIYIHQGKIDAGLSILRDRRQHELTMAREQERHDFKLVDAYGGQEKFTFDSYLVSFLETCQCIVESGTAYAERLIQQGHGTKEELLAHFPVWPMCLVVQEGDKAELERKLLKVRSSLSSPVFIMTTGEARLAAEGIYPQMTILPEFWPAVLEEQSFTQWKELFSQKAQQSQEVRASKELLCRDVEIIYQSLNEFLVEYPHADYVRCQQDKNVVQDQLTGLKSEIIKTAKEEQDTLQTLKLCQDTISNLEGKANDLNRKIEKANEWQQKEQARLLEQTALAQCQKEIVALRKQLEVLSEEERVALVDQEQLAKKRASWEKELNQLVGEELYQELQGFSPVVPLLTEGNLRARRLRLKEELAHINSSREVIQNRIRTYRQELNNFNQRLQRYTVIVPEEMTFPTDGDIQLKNLQTDIFPLKADVKKQEQQLREVRFAWETAKTRREERETFYLEKTSPHIHLFTELLSVVKERLSIRSTSVAQELVVAGETVQKVQQQVTQWGKLCAEMVTRNGKLEFLADHILSKPLTGEDAHSFLYQSHKMVLRLLEELKNSHEQLEQRKNNVEKSRNNFETFCGSKNFQNEKMRQSLLNGIRQRRGYSQMLAWEQELKQSIQVANTVAEHNMLAYNEDIKHFINQLHLHLLSICDEILIIQRMTGVKIEDHYKTIYEIKTPLWEENAAKEKLMEHLEWMTEQLAAETYKQDDGLEDVNKIRKNIERWLSASYLFMRISPNKGFTVTVRKVSNDNRISNIPADWATSNSWSGGEKWSKNMALFLGIQSYLSEKRQPLTPGRANNRTVVLDNPFGQASSDHVLEPVFYIAGKLGFQVIALTALAEGKFLRDYFPIIYSCRLRSAEGGETSIMGKELHINHAFFQDNAPQTLARLGQVTQIQLL